MQLHVAQRKKRFLDFCGTTVPLCSSCSSINVPGTRAPEATDQQLYVLDTRGESHKVPVVAATRETKGEHQGWRKMKKESFQAWLAQGNPNSGNLLQHG